MNSIARFTGLAGLLVTAAALATGCSWAAPAGVRLTDSKGAAKGMGRGKRPGGPRREASR